ncbi:MAG: DUF2971 domain-containing protein [Clostridium sp.]|nr:DUF2971 domain-containing protein [Acetatifactor muris]MCM1527812.1 DUF2971 domain-containing protein [Bacteroides sp.]MCM1563492.1 DUF2971 domain-containing protein [Clostridium sp.]
MLYHYTDFAAFDGIIRCAELRLNNILNMNDAAEMRLFINGICKAVIERLEQERETEKILLTGDFFRKELDKEFHYSAYAACFSKYRDDAAQWERYGHFGQGVCIALQEDLMQEMTGGAIALREVYYQNDMREHFLVEEFYRAIMESETFSDNLVRLQTLMKEAWVQSAAFKHPSFASEREFRLVVSPFVMNEFAIEPKYHVTTERIKKYYPLDLNRMCDRLGLHLPDLVGEIIIGPTSSQSIPILQDYLVDNGLSVLKDRITMSECPLRKPTS